MKMPFVSRKRYEKLQEQYNRDSGIVAYLPQDNQNPSVGTNLSHHDKRIGWVKSMKFKSYDDYLEYIRKSKKEQL